MTSGDGVHTYKWDAENRLIEIDYVGTSNKSVFTYNGVGERITDAETVSGMTTTSRYLWCGDQICQVRDGSDNVQHRNVEEGTYFPAGPWFHGNLVDQLGSVRDGIDLTSGNFHQAFDYTPYGAVAQQAGWHYADYDYQFAGLFMHEASGIEFSGTRPYDPNTGKWLQRDLIRESGGANLYGYAGGNPIKYRDPTGRAPWDDPKLSNPAFTSATFQHSTTFNPGDLIGKLWGLPNTAIGVVAGSGAYISGVVAGTSPSIQLGNNAIQVLGSPLGPSGAITLGNVQIYNGTTPNDTIISPYDSLPVVIGQHEEAHTYQSQALGPLFFPVYFGLGGISGSNPLESAADAYGRGQGGPFTCHH